MLTTPDDLILYYMPCDNLQNYLFHHLSWCGGEADWPVDSWILLLVYTHWWPGQVKGAPTLGTYCYSLIFLSIFTENAYNDHILVRFQWSSLNNIPCKHILNIFAKILMLRLASQDQYVIFIFLFLFSENILDI